MNENLKACVYDVPFAVMGRDIILGIREIGARTTYQNIDVLYHPDKPTKSQDKLPEKMAIPDSPNVMPRPSLPRKS